MTSKNGNVVKSRSFASPAVHPSAIAVVVLIGIVTGACTLSQITNYDIWRNLAVGRWISENQQIPREEFLSFTEAGKPWIDYEWLSELIFWHLHRLASVSGLVLYKVCIVWISVIFLFLAYRNRGSGTGFAFVWALIPALVLSENRFLVRPHIHSFLLAAFLLWWVGGNRGGLLVPLLTFCLWGNLHGGHVGLLLLALFSISGLLRARRIAVVLSAVVGLLINPYTWKIVLPLLRIISIQTPSRLLVAEWAPLSLLEMPWFGVYSAVSILLLFVKGRTQRISDAVVIFVFLVLSLRSIRMMPYLLLLAAPGNAEALDLLAARIPYRLPIRLVPVISGGFVFFFVTLKLPFTIGVNTRLYPEAAATYVMNKQINANCFNDMHQGSFLAFQWYPTKSIYMDGRTELFADLAATERAASHDVTSWISFMDGLKIDAAIVDYPRLWRGVETATLYPMFRFLRWSVVAWDDGGVLLLRPGEERDSLITRDAYEILDPFIIDPSPTGFSLREHDQYLMELDRACSTISRSARVWFIAGNFNTRANRPASALAAYANIDTIAPGDQDLHARKALALEKLARLGPATAEWKRQLRVGVDRSHVYYHLGRLSLLQGNPQKARTWLQKAVDQNPSNTQWQSLLRRASSPEARNAGTELASRQRAATTTARSAVELMAESKWPEAQELLLQALNKAPWLAELHQNLGACFANQGLWALAKAELDEALLQDPDLGWARYNRAGLFVMAHADTAAALADLGLLQKSTTDASLRSMAAAFRARLVPEDTTSLRRAHSP